MKRALSGALLMCCAAFAQSVPQNAAADALKKRLEGMKLLNPPQAAVTLRPRPDPAAAAPKICAIPLLNVIPPGTSDKMPAVKPSLPVNPGAVVRVPAPPCER